MHWDHVFSDEDHLSFMVSEFHGFEYRSSNGFAPPVTLAQGDLDNGQQLHRHRGGECGSHHRQSVVAAG